MKRLMIVLVVALMTSTAAAQSSKSQFLRDMANSFLSIAEGLDSMVGSAERASHGASQGGFLKKIAPAELALVGQTSEAAAKAMRRQARAYELLALKLRRQALKN